jgi:hypothetical protein
MQQDGPAFSKCSAVKNCVFDWYNFKCAARMQVFLNLRAVYKTTRQSNPAYRQFKIQSEHATEI